MRLCHDSEISLSVVLLLLLLLRDVGEGGGGCGTVMWVRASLGYKARVGSISYIRNSCLLWVSSLLFLLHRW